MSNARSETVVSANPGDTRRERRARLWQRWLKWFVAAMACLWLADAGLSLLIEHSALKRHLTSRLEAAFGRPVDVGSYAFSLWRGPEIVARSIRVAEDPRFGQEYFLRSESLTVRVRLWRSLFGHLELGTISLSHPSLNLVRSADGDWNLAEWLPRPVNAMTPAETTRVPLRRRSAPLFRKVEVDAGRINFKRQDEKLPFAFVGVTGTLDAESSGRWRLDLVAVPTRAAVIAQDPGILHLVGHLGGTASRLRPAELEIDWSEASIPDVLRLLTDRDYGLRGALGVSVVARTNGDSWLLKANASATQLHRWDLPLRADNPSLSLRADGHLDASGSRFELTSARIETPHSSAGVVGALDWGHPGPALAELLLPSSRARASRTSRLPPPAESGTELRVTSNEISLADLLDGARAFHSGIADGVSLDGVAHFSAVLDGWPPRFHDATFDLPRGALSGRGIRSPVHFESVLAHYDLDRGITLAPASIAIGGPPSLFRVEGSAKPAAGEFSLHVRGGTLDVREIVSIASGLGWNLARGWSVAGPVHCDLRWQRTGKPLRTAHAGSVDWGTPSEGVSLAAPFLNQPVEQIRARAQLQTGFTHVTLSSADAFGARWSGTLDHRLSDGWKFSVSGNSVSAANLDRWLDPRWRESFLDRMLPFLNSRASVGGALGSLHASGRIAIENFSLAPVAVHYLRGDLTLDGRHLEFANVAGQFYQGQLAGSLRADFTSPPKYETSLDFSDVDLHALSEAFPSLAGRLAGSASAKIHFDLRGASRSDLSGSLECYGRAWAKDLSAQKISLVGQAARDTLAQTVRTDPSPFQGASATFACASGKIRLFDLALSAAETRWNGAGSIDFAHNLDLRLRLARVDTAQPQPANLDGGAAAKGADMTGTGYTVTGTLESPRVSRVSAPPRASGEGR